jgi:hypothetical protein
MRSAMAADSSSPWVGVLSLIVGCISFSPLHRLWWLGSIFWVYRHADFA